MVTPLPFTLSAMTHHLNVSCVMRSVIGVSPSLIESKVLSMTHDTFARKNQSISLRAGVRVRVRMRVRTRTHLKHSVISVTSVIYRGKIAMTLAMTLAGPLRLVSSAKGGCLHA